MIVEKRRLPLLRVFCPLDVNIVDLKWQPDPSLVEVFDRDSLVVHKKIRFVSSPWPPLAFPF